jgi:hypothetical protein
MGGHRARGHAAHRAVSLLAPPPSSPGSLSPSQPGQLPDQRHQDSPVRLHADRHQCDGHHPGHAALPADDPSTHTSAHQIYGASARTLYATLGESILRHLVSAGCCMPFRCGVSTMLTLAPVRSAWQRQSAHGHPRLMSQMVTAGREVAREIRRSARLRDPWRIPTEARRTCRSGCVAILPRAVAKWV